MKKFKTYEKQAKYQNMEVARVKAIAILEVIIGNVIRAKKWFEYEDKIVNIINSK